MAHPQDISHTYQEMLVADAEGRLATAWRVLSTSTLRGRKIRVGHMYGVSADNVRALCAKMGERKVGRIIDVLPEYNVYPNSGLDARIWGAR